MRNGTFVDCHCHPLVPAVVDALTQGELGALSLPRWSVDEQLATMDRHGIGVAMLSVNGVAEGMVGAKGRATARAINEALAGLVAQHPTRFGGLACVPMDDMDAANEETAHALDVLKLDGVGVVTQCHGRYLGEPHYDPWLAEMNRRATTLFVHPAAPPGFDAQRSPTNVSVLEFMFETTRMVTTMVLSGAKVRYDRIAMIATHGGGTIPYLAHRIGSAGSMPWAYRDGPRMTPGQIASTLSTFFFDLTAATAHSTLDALRALVPADRLLTGFDFPLMPEATIAPAIEAFEAYSGFDADERRKIVRENAVRLFPRLGSTQ